MGQYASHILSSWLGNIWIDASDYNLCSFSGLMNIHISTAVDGNGEIYCAAVRTIYCWLNLHILTTVFTPILEQAYFMEQALSLGAGLAVIFGAVVFWSRHIEFGAGLYWSSWHWRGWGTWLRMSDLPTFGLHGTARHDTTIHVQNDVRAARSQNATWLNDWTTGAAAACSCSIQRVCKSRQNRNWLHTWRYH